MIETFQVKLFQHMLVVASFNPERSPILSFKTSKHITRPSIDRHHRLVAKVGLVDETIGRDLGAECEGDVEY